LNTHGHFTGFGIPGYNGKCVRKARLFIEKLCTGIINGKACKTANE